MTILRAMCCLLLLAGPAGAANMTPVAAADGHCHYAEAWGASCHEWRFAHDPSLRFIADGYEDGMEYWFATRRDDGTYAYLVRVFPVLRDPSRPGSLYWGYGWDIHDIVLPGGGNRMLATFDHAIVDDGEVDSPDWQQRVPAVLFEGRTTQPGMTVPKLAFFPANVEALQEGAGEPERASRERGWRKATDADIAAGHGPATTSNDGAPGASALALDMDADGRADAASMQVNADGRRLGVEVCLSASGRCELVYVHLAYAEGIGLEKLAPGCTRYRYRDRHPEDGGGEVCHAGDALVYDVRSTGAPFFVYDRTRRRFERYWAAD